MKDNSCYFYINDKIKNQFDLLKNLKNKKKGKIFYIYKNYSKNKNNLSKRYNIEKNFSLFINKSNTKSNNLKNSNINEDTNNNIPKDNNGEYFPEKKHNLSNTIKIRKNKKMIYMNKSLIKEKIKKNDVIIHKKNRSSLYRGVSKNGNYWQVIISSKYTKGYVGLFKTPEIAARIYDIISIKNKGIKAKTNFQYNLHQIQNISEENIDYKSKNIEEIISDLIQK